MLLGVVAILGGFFIWAYRLYVDVYPVIWQAVVMLIVGIVMAVMGLLFLAVPKLYMPLLKKFSEMPALQLRLLFAVGVVFGIIIILLGVSL